MKKYLMKSTASSIRLKGVLFDIVDGVVTAPDDFIMPKNMYHRILDDVVEETVEDVIVDEVDDTDTFVKDINVDYENYTVKELRDMLLDKGVEVGKDLKKVELVELAEANL